MSRPDDPARRYAEAHTSPADTVVAAIRAETVATMETPQMAGGLVEVRLLEALVVASRATRVLEIGTFTGVTAVSLAARLAPGGRLVTIEADPKHADAARRNIASSPFADRIELLEGDALDLLRSVDGPFDVVFLDAWKRDYPAYYEAVLPKLAPHGVLVADNLLYGGRVLDPDTEDDSARTLQRFARAVLDDPRVDSALLTVGDGLLLVWRR